MELKNTQKSKAPHLTTIMNDMIDKIKDTDFDFQKKFINEVFDEEIRGELWMECVETVEKVEDDKCISKIREIVNIDKVRFELKQLFLKPIFGTVESSTFTENSSRLG